MKEILDRLEKIELIKRLEKIEERLDVYEKRISQETKIWAQILNKLEDQVIRINSDRKIRGE